MDAFSAKEAVNAINPLLRMDNKQDVEHLQEVLTMYFGSRDPNRDSSDSSDSDSEPEAIVGA